MPFLFVHGVGNRRDDPSTPDTNELKRIEQFRNITLRYIQKKPYEGYAVPAYWGDLGAKLGWDGATLPKQLSRFDSLGSDDTFDLDTQDPRAEHFLAEVAHADNVHGFDESVDIALAVAYETWELEELDSLDAFADLAAAYADERPRPDWCRRDLTNDAFIDELFKAVKEYADAGDDPGAGSAGPSFIAMGGALGNLLSKVKKAAGRLIGIPRNGISRVALGIKRDSLNTSAANFVGDVFAYIDRRGDSQNPGPIPNRILGALRDAHEQRTPDDPLIIVGHSMGGIILYDLFTAYVPTLLPELKVDHYVTVGSQVGFMQEMDHFVANRGATPDDGPLGRPGCVDRWINVFDKTDPLS